MRVMIAPAVILAGAMALSSTSAVDEPPFTLDVESPEKGGTCDGALVEFCAVLKGVPEKLTIVRIKAFDRTHNLVVDPQDPWIRAGGSAQIIDPFLLAPEGRHVVWIEILERGAQGELLVATASSFGEITVVKPDAEEVLAEMNELRSDLASGSGNAQWSRTEYCRQVFYDKTARKDVMNTADGDAGSAAEQYVWGQVDEFDTRVGAYSELAELYERDFKPGEALAALRLADSIYNEGKGVVLSGPLIDRWPIIHDRDGVNQAPDHLFGFASFYLRRNDLSRAQPWLEAYAAWYEEQLQAPHLNAAQRLECRREIAGAYRTIAQAHVLLSCDLAAYDKWMARFRQALPPELARPSEDNRGLVVSE